jgi:hypothetical protein
MARTKKVKEVIHPVPKFKIGDRVKSDMVHSNGWDRGTIVSIGWAEEIGCHGYEVRYDNPEEMGRETFHNPEGNLSLIDDTPKEEPKRTLRLLSWDKGIQAGMLHIQADGKSAVYHVRRINSVTPTFQFQKVQPGADGVTIQFPYTVHIYKSGSEERKGVCQCDGYKHRKTCRHVDAAITMVEEYNV